MKRNTEVEGAAESLGQAEVSKLSDEELRVKVARLCGLNIDRHNPALWDIHYQEDRPQRIPNYPADLNAMFEAERAFIFGPKLEHSDRAFLYSQLLTGMAHPNCFATARQRAEAFVLTLGLSKKEEEK